MKVLSFTTSVALFAGLALFPACDPIEPGLSSDGVSVDDFLDESGRIDWRNVHPNDTRQNGIRFNGVRFNGVRFNGVRFNGVRFNGVRFNGTNLNSPQVNDHRIKAKNANNEDVAGPALEGAIVDADFDNGSVQAQLEFRFSSMGTVNTPSGSLDAMIIEQRELPNGTFTNACENGSPSVSLRGDWNPDTGAKVSDSADSSSWACLGAALGDCATWGYIPGRTNAGQDLAGFHQACTRTKRADYCGNGVSHTQNGTSIDVYDSLGLQTPGTAWPIEAFYNENGAVCINNPRKTNFTHSGVVAECAAVGKSIGPCVDVNSDGQVNFADYPTAKIAVRNVPTDPV